MRLEMLVEMQIEILDSQSSCLFSNEPFEKRPGMTIEDFGLHSDDHFESHLLRCVAMISRLLEIVGLFCRRALQKRPWMTIEDFGLHSDEQFESHLLGNGLYLCPISDIGWLLLVGSTKLQVSFAEYSLFYRALLQKRPII